MYESLLEDVLALKRAVVVSMFRTVYMYSVRPQDVSFILHYSIQTNNCRHANPSSYDMVKRHGQKA